MRIRHLRRRMAWLSRGRSHALDLIVGKRVRRRLVTSIERFQLAVVAAGQRLIGGSR